MMMSALRQKRTFSELCVTSALPPKADIAERDHHVCFVPEADSRAAAKGAVIRSPRRRGRSRTSRWSNGVADVPRRYWNLIKLDLERTERIRDSICKRGGRADRATFADTLNAERIERRW
jgi:hypothetical protein